MAPVFQDFLLPFHFIFNGSFQGLEGVQVLDFCPGAEFLGPYRHNGNVGITAHRAFLHLAVADPSVLEVRPEFFHIGTGFRRRPHIRFGYDFDQRHTGPVVVHCREIRGADGSTGMDQFPGIFFHMDPGDADSFGFPIHVHVQMPVQGDGLIELGNLVGFGQIRIIVVLPVELAVALDLAVDGQGKPQGKFHHLLVDDGQSPGHAQAHRAYMGVGGTAEFRRAGAESLGLGFQFCMDFQTNYGCIFCHYFKPPRGATALWKSVACSKV